MKTVAFAIALAMAPPLASDQTSEVSSTDKLQGVWEGEIEDPRRPVVVAVDFTAKQASMSGAAPIELTVRGSPSLGAVAFDIVRGSEQPLAFTGTLTDNRISGFVQTGQRQIPFWLERLPDLPPPRDRAEAWRQDLDVVLARYLRYDRSFSADGRAAARRRIEELKASVNQRADADMQVERARAIALSGNAHTRLYLVRNRTEVRRLPVRFWWFRDELRIVRAAERHRALLGCRILRVGETDIATAFRRVRDIKAGNASWQRYMSAYFLSSPDILYGARVIDDPERVGLTVACDGEPTLVELTPLPLKRSSTPVEAWWDLVPSYPHKGGGFATALAADRAPRYLRNTENYWYESVADEKTIYFQYNRSQENPVRPMSGFIEQLERAIAERPLEALIVDVRFNTGGDAGVGSPLVERLASRLEGVPVFVLTGRATFSAGIMHAAQWKQLARATIVGEPVGDSLDMWSEGGNLLLPHSKLTVHYANGFHANSRREYPQFRPHFSDLDVSSIEPDLLVEPAWADYVAGRDSVYGAVVARIRSIRTKR
jgi:hypothetical protein